MCQQIRATLISVIGSKPYGVLADLCSPVSPLAKTYAQLAIILKNHLAPNTLIIAERYRFHNYSQREGQSVATFAANLKHLASTCDFGAHLNEALCDCFVCGLRSKEIQKKFLTDEHTFDRALKIALGAEVAEKDVAGFSQNAVAQVNKLDLGNRRTFHPCKPCKPPAKGQANKPSQASQHNNTGTSECLSCGRSSRTCQINN